MEPSDRRTNLASELAVPSPQSISPCRVYPLGRERRLRIVPMTARKLWPVIAWIVVPVRTGWVVVVVGGVVVGAGATGLGEIRIAAGNAKESNRRSSNDSISGHRNPGRDKRSDVLMGSPSRVCDRSVATP